MVTDTVSLAPGESARFRVKLTAAAARTEVNAAAMSVLGVICSRSRDRDGDIIEPSGADTRRHQANPVVFLNHGIVGGIPGMTLPVGKAVDPAGQYTVRYDAANDVLVARTYFDQDSATAAEVFRLYDDDILRGFSIGFLPLRVKRILDKLPGRPRPGHHVDRWELLEYSCVGVPNNPDALRVKLQNGFGPGVNPILKSVLEPLAADPATWSPGWTPPVVPEPSLPPFLKGSLMSATATPAPAVECHAILFPPDQFTADQAREWLTKGHYTPENDYPARDPAPAEHPAFGGDGKCLAYFRVEPERVDPATFQIIDLAGGVKGVYAAVKSAAPITKGTGDGTAGSHQPGKEAAGMDPKAPFGGQVLLNLLEHIAEHVGQVEHPKTKKVLLKTAKALLACCKDCYPDVKAATIPGLDEDKDDDDPMPGGGMKVYLPPGKVIVDAAALVRVTKSLEGVQQEFFRATGRELPSLPTG